MGLKYKIPEIRKLNDQTEINISLENKNEKGLLHLY